LKEKQNFLLDLFSSPTVRNAARDVATAGINSALNSDENQRVIS